MKVYKVILEILGNTPYYYSSKVKAENFANSYHPDCEFRWLDNVASVSYETGGIKGWITKITVL